AVACGPAASSAIEMALTATSADNRDASRRSRSMSTEVSMRPLGRRSATRLGTRARHTIEIATEALVVNVRRALEDCDNRVRTDKAVPSQWCELADGHAVTGHDERLAFIEAPHDLPAVVAELSLSDLPCHSPTVARRATARRPQTRGRARPRIAECAIAS